MVLECDVHSLINKSQLPLTEPHDAPIALYTKLRGQRYKLLHFPPLQFGADNSSPAFFSLAFQRPQQHSRLARVVFGDTPISLKYSAAYVERSLYARNQLNTGSCTQTLRNRPIAIVRR